MAEEHVIEINPLASQPSTVRSSQTGASSGPPEFTRRQNWSQSILEELRDMVHVLGSDLCLLYCSPASQACLGYQPTELIGHVLTEFLHVDDIDPFVRAFQKGQPIRTIYRFLRKDGKYVMLESHGHFYQSAFFATARCVPSETTGRMDRFLDLRMENDRLRQRLGWVKAKKARAGWEEGLARRSEGAFQAVSHPGVYTLGVLDSFGATESVNLFTGLQFDLGERSRGISMGLEGELFNTVMPSRVGDEGVSELKMGKKRKGQDQAKMCTDCGRTDAPEWRKGPKGPKTLCNACGLRWSKANKPPNKNNQ